jgi:hypothetical protein
MQNFYLQYFYDIWINRILAAGFICQAAKLLSSMRAKLPNGLQMLR